MVLALMMLAPMAMAGTCYVKTPNGKTVNMRSEIDNSVVAQIPYGTKLTYDDDESTETAAYVTYKGKSGYVRWVYLSKTYPGAYHKPTATPLPEPMMNGEGEYSVNATGAVIQYPNKKGKAAGTKYDTVRFTEPIDIVITASVPKGKKLAGWKINGVYITFFSTVKTFRLPEVTEDLTVEAVFK